MGLVACRACGLGISSEAQACPRCGHPVPRDPVRRALVYGFVSVLVFAATWYVGKWLIDRM